MSDERCWLCKFWNGERCTQTWRLVIHVEPLGGQMEYSTAPGMVPEELKPRLTEFFEKFTAKLAETIQLLPIWDEIREFQLANMPERKDCPARVESKTKRAYLKVVKK